jgi:hypothetical protein
MYPGVGECVPSSVEAVAEGGPSSVEAAVEAWAPLILQRARKRERARAREYTVIAAKNTGAVCCFITAGVKKKE